MGHYRDLMLRDLQIRGYAVNTQKAYIRQVRQFVGYFMRPPDELTMLGNPSSRAQTGRSIMCGAQHGVQPPL